LLSEADWLDISQIVEHREGLAGLQGLRLRLCPQGTRQDVELISDPDDLVHALSLSLGLNWLIVLTSEDRSPPGSVSQMGRGEPGDILNPGFPRWILLSR
jgi:hypothetical protein